jgi:hypothetical protein
MGNPEEAARAAQQQNHEDDPPPPYSAEGAPPPLPPRETKNNPFLSGGQPSSSSQPAPESEPPVARTLPTPIRPSKKFPVTCGMFYQKAVGVPTFNLGAQQDQPVFSVTFHGGGGAGQQPYLVLRATTYAASPPLAVVERADRQGRRSDVLLPPLAEDGGQAVLEPLHSHVSFTSVMYAFAIEVLGPDGVLRRERFEWRSSKGNEVRALLDLDGEDGGRGSPPGRGKIKALGRKLVRLSAEAEGVGGTRAVRDSGASSDGREVVAAWADNPRWSANRAGTLRFLGSGATGEMGDRFTVMAAATALRIWEIGNESSLISAATEGQSSLHD